MFIVGQGTGRPKDRRDKAVTGLWTKWVDEKMTNIKCDRVPHFAIICVTCYFDSDYVNLGQHRHGLPA